MECHGIDSRYAILQGRWWFGSRQKTKDGIHAQTASTFFKSLTENASIDEVFTTLSKASEFSHAPSTSKAAKPSAEQELKELEKKIAELEKAQWAGLKELLDEKGESMHGRRRVLILLHAHLLRLEIHDSGLKQGLSIAYPLIHLLFCSEPPFAEQSALLLQTPSLLNALLTIAMARNWLQPTVAVMRLHAYLTQALLPLPSSTVYDPERRLQKYAQLPGLKQEDVRSLGIAGEGLDEIVTALEGRNDDRVGDIKKAVGRWGHVEIVDAQFKGAIYQISASLIYTHLNLYRHISPRRTNRHAFSACQPPRQTSPRATIHRLYTVERFRFHRRLVTLDSLRSRDRKGP